jgi:hypothetical protein
MVNSLDPRSRAGFGSPTQAALAALAVALAGCGTDPPCPPGDLAPPPRAPAFAVLLTDYDSTAVALLDAAGDVITESWIDSGTRASGIAGGLGGDAVLVEGLCPERLAILERFGSDLLTIVSFRDGALAQIDLRGDDPRAPTGHSPNPQHAIRIDNRHALVARLNPAFDPRTPAFGRGNDLVVVDLERRTIVDRVELDADVEVPSPLDPERRVLVYARPSSLALLERGGVRRVVVGGARRSADFTVGGPGALAIVDPDARARSALLTLDGRRNCHTVAPIPGDSSRAMALCSGNTFAGSDARRAHAAVLRIALADDGSAAIDAEWDAASEPAAPPPTSGLVPLDATRALVVADPRGDEGAGKVDRLLLLDLEHGRASVLFEASDAFALGTGTYDPVRGLVLLPDAHARAVHRIDVGTSVRIRDAVRIPTCRTLPPRQVVRVDP